MSKHPDWVATKLIPLSFSIAWGHFQVFDLDTVQINEQVSITSCCFLQKDNLFSKKYMLKCFKTGIDVTVPLYNAVLININEYVCINSDREVHISLNILNYKHVLKISSYKYTY